MTEPRHTRTRVTCRLKMDDGRVIDVEVTRPKSRKPIFELMGYINTVVGDENRNRYKFVGATIGPFWRERFAEYPLTDAHA